MSYALRFPGTTDKMRRHLTTKMREAVAAGEARAADISRWVDDVIATLLRVRVLDDEAWAETRARSLHRRGRATAYIARDLTQRRAAPGAADKALEALREDVADPDLTAALLLARKKRLGPYGAPLPTDPLARRKARDKQLAAFARAGFPLALARRIVDAPTVEALEPG